MHIKKILLTFTFTFTIIISAQSVKKVRYASTLKNNSLVEQTYCTIDEKNNSIPSLSSFTMAFEGYQNLKSTGLIEKDILTIIDFSISSTSKRLWIIDMENHKVLHHTLVSHGKNSGEEFANVFSNVVGSEKSSLGFYATAETYTGKNGYSLKIDGLSGNLNNKARERAVVIHSAEYVSYDFINQNGKLGRSQGCPALPKELTKEIIDLIKNKSCLFIYHPKLEENSIEQIEM
jgi:hypothetical protein